MALCLVFVWVCLNSITTTPNSPVEKKKKKGKMGKKKFRRKRGVVALMRDEINCTFCFHMYPIEVYLSEDAQQCGSSSVYSVRSDGVCYIGFPASHWL